jgi:hypothetical protein
MSAPDELEALRSLRADIGVLDATIDLRIRARIAEGLAAATDAEATTPAPIVLDAPAEPDEFGLYEFDPTPSEADQRSDTPATLRPPRRHGRPGHRRVGDGAGAAAPDASSDAAWGIEVPTARHPDRSVHRRRPTRSGGARALRVIAVAAALVLLVAGGTAIIRTRQGTPDERGTAGSVDATAAPLAVADLVALQRQLPPVQLAPGTYQYTDIVEGHREDQVDTTGSTPLFTSQRNQRWVDRDGNGREVAGPASVRPFDDPSAPPQDVGRSFDLPLRLPRAFGGYTYDELQGLPTDPDALRQQLLAGNEITSADVPGLARLAGRLLELPATPPAVRASLVAMLERDGLRSVGDRADRLGRRGSGFELDADGHRWTYIVDRATGRLLTREERALGSELVEGDSLVQPSAIPAVTTDTGGG